LFYSLSYGTETPGSNDTCPVYTVTPGGGRSGAILKIDGSNEMA
jgi:hypothetical protein